MTWFNDEMERYQHHDIYRFNPQELPTLDFRHFYRPLYNFEKEQVGWTRPAHLWVKSSYFCLASDKYNSPAQEHLKFDLEKVLAGLFLQKAPVSIADPLTEFRTPFGIVKPIYREGSISDFVGRTQVPPFEIHRPVEIQPQLGANEDTRRLER